MKNWILYLLPLSIIILVTSCDQNSCENVVCSGNNATCFEGQCVCEVGYEGDLCELYTYQKYIGNYQVSQNCTSTLQGNLNSTYNSYVGQGVDIDRLTISSFGGQYTIEAYFVPGTNGNELFIPEQVIFGNTTITGSGIFYPNQYRININYSLTQGSDYRECTAIYQRI